MAIMNRTKWLPYFLLPLFMAMSCKYSGTENNQAREPVGESVMEQISYANNAEIDLSQMASRNAEDARVKEYAEMMIDEHRQAQEVLDSLADERNINLPGNLKDTHQELKDSLNNLDGIAFDSAYIQSQIQMHTTTIDLFESISDTTEDQNLKNFVDEYLPKIKMHRMKADSIADMLNTTEMDV